MPRLGLDDARAILDAALAAARTEGIRVSCCVVDAEGHEVAAARMDGAPPFTSGVARAKARTSAVMRADSASLAELRATYPELVVLIDNQLPFDFTTLPGGVVIRDGEDVLGAVGVSGAHPDQDVACAQAGIAARPAG